MTHYSFFDDGSWACGGTWPEPVSLKPFVTGHDHRITFRWEEVTCPGCLVYRSGPDRRTKPLAE